MNKKITNRVSLVGIFALSAVLGSLPGCNKQDATGTVIGEGTSTNGIGGPANPVTVKITLEDGKIINVEAEGPGETAGIGTKPLESFPTQMVEGNTIKLDAVSGATITSNAIMEAAAEAIKAAGLNPDDYQNEVATVISSDDITEECDVVVVGAGGAGMTAAITAADEGKKVIIVESQSMAGGNTVRATGGLNAADTKYQDENEFAEEKGVEKTLKNAKENDEVKDLEYVKGLVETVTKQWAEYQANPEGYFDSPELMALDTIIGGHGINDPELLTVLTENSAGAIDWLKEHGAELKSVGAAGGASVKRIHRPLTEDGKVAAVGAYIVPILEKNLADEGIEVIYNTTIDKILTEDGKAVGVSGKGTAGNSVVINSKAVIIATGGFGGNNEMVSEYRPDLKGVVTTNAAGAQGQGILIAEEIGADTVDMDQIQVHPTVHVDPDGNAHLITEGVRGDGAILVNKEGKRFYDEVLTRDKVSAAEKEQTDGEVWLILDQAMVDGAAVYQGYVDAGYAEKGETIEELAKAMNVDPKALSETMSDWAEIYKNKEDPEFGRTSFSSKYALDTAPYYAILVAPGIHHTMGGLKIDTKTEVLDKEGNPIDGLFAAGEVTGGIHGGNRLGGTAVTDIIVFGEIAGASAAEYVGK